VTVEACQVTARILGFHRDHARDDVTLTDLADLGVAPVDCVVLIRR
jgi:hypothetical protein